MLIEVVKSKIGHAHVTEAELMYEGSISIDQSLMEAVDLIQGQKVQVLNINNGNRFETYVIPGPAGSGQMCLNGPAARQGLVGDQLIVISYALVSVEEARSFQPKIIHLDDHNHIKSRN